MGNKFFFWLVVKNSRPRKSDSLRFFCFRRKFSFLLLGEKKCTSAFLSPDKDDDVDDDDHGDDDDDKDDVDDSSAICTSESAVAVIGFVNTAVAQGRTFILLF